MTSFFYQKSHTSNYWFIKAPRLGVRSLWYVIWVLVWFNKDDTLAGSSGMNTQHSIWLMIEVPPHEAVKTSGPSYLGDGFPHERPLSVQWGQALVIPFKAFWVNLVRASTYPLTSFRAMEGIKTAVNGCASGRQNMALRRGRSAVLGTWPGCAYHTCWLGEAALSGMRCTGGRICQTRSPSFSPLSVVCVFHFR